MVLAAGAGRRFAGGDKLLAPWRGAPLLCHVLAAAVAARARGLLERIVVVHAPGAGPIRDLAVAAGAVPAEAERADAGLSESLRAGLGALPDGEAAVILLGDQPAVAPETIAALIAAAGPLSHALVRPRYRSAPPAPGHPVLVGRAHWPLAAEASGDRGLDPVLARHGLTWRLVPVDGANPDIDTAADLATLEDSDPCE